MATLYTTRDHVVFCHIHLGHLRELQPRLRGERQQSKLLRATTRRAVSIRYCREGNDVQQQLMGQRGGRIPHFG